MVVTVMLEDDGDESVDPQRLLCFRGWYLETPPLNTVVATLAEDDWAKVIAPKLLNSMPLFASRMMDLDVVRSRSIGSIVL